MPMLAPTNDSAPWIVNGSPNASYTRLAISIAALSAPSPPLPFAAGTGSMSASSIRNSSAPSRATRSIVRATSRSREAAWRSSSSPAARPGERQLEVLLEQPAVRQAGNAVIAGEVGDLLFGALAVADVAREGEEEELRPAGVEQPHAHLHRERRAVLAAEDGLDRHGASAG